LCKESRLYLKQPCVRFVRTKNKGNVWFVQEENGKRKIGSTV
jgi:hypothetical protein